MVVILFSQNTQPLFALYYTETLMEFENIARDFTLLPRTFMGALIDKFVGGLLGGKGWPAGTIQAAELHGDYSFLGLENIGYCYKYHCCLNNHFMADTMKKRLVQLWGVLYQY